MLLNNVQPLHACTAHPVCKLAFTIGCIRAACGSVCNNAGLAAENSQHATPHIDVAAAAVQQATELVLL